MKRRDFIKRSSLASGLFFVPNFIKNIESQSINNLGFRKLVIIQLSGGNDGLNSIIKKISAFFLKVLLNVLLHRYLILRDGNLYYTIELNRERKSSHSHCIAFLRFF